MEKLKKFSLFLIPLFIVISIVFYVIRGAYSQITQISFLISIIIVIFVLILNYQNVLNFFKKTGGLKSAVFLIQFFLLLGSLMFFYLFVSTLNIKLDLTKGKLYTLTDESLRILKNVTNEMKVYYFKPANISDPVLDYIETLLKRYSEKNKNIVLKFVDPIQNRAMAIDYDIKENGSVVFESEKKKIIVSPKKVIDQNIETGEIFYKGEEVFTKAIKNLLFYKPRNVYILQGHGEITPYDGSHYGFKKVFELLAQENIKLRELNLMKIPEIPSDCSLIIIGNPKAHFLVEELDKLALYLENGGNILVLLEYETDFTINDILRRAGLFYLENLIVEDEDYLPQLGRTTIFPNFASHEITKPLIENRKIVFLQTAAGILSLPDEEKEKEYEFEISPLLTTSKTAWGEVSKSEILSNKVLKDKKDLKGPLNIAYAVKRKSKSSGVTSRIGAIGDTDLINNLNIDKYSNFEFFINLVNFLLGREEEVGIKPRKAGLESFKLSGYEKRFLGVLAFFPLIIFILPGIIVILYRKGQKRKANIY